MAKQARQPTADALAKPEYKQRNLISTPPALEKAELLLLYRRGETNTHTNQANRAMQSRPGLYHQRWQAGRVKLAFLAQFDGRYLKFPALQLDERASDSLFTMWLQTPL